VVHTRLYKIGDTIKLVRDKYIDIIEKENLDLTQKSPEQKLNLILDKIKEEALEFLESNQRDPKELADLMEVIIAWGQMNDLSFDIVNHLRKEKHKKLGGFENFVVLLNDEKSPGESSEEHY